MKFLKRIFKIGEAEANAAVDKFENPISMTEQGIRDLKEDLAKSMEALAKVKAMVIRSKSEAEDYADKAKDYENKALLLLQKAEKGDLDADKADNLATEALVKKQECDNNFARCKDEQAKNESHAESLTSNMGKIKSTITKWENELHTLKARHEVSEATKNINKQLADMNSDSTVSMLKRMKEKVDQEEALAESYLELANENKGVDEAIEDALDGEKEAAQTALAKLKAKIQGTNKK